MFSFSPWLVIGLFAVCAVACALVASRLFKDWVRVDFRNRENAPETIAVAIVLLLFLVAGNLLLTTVSGAGVAVGSNGTIYVNPTRSSRVIFGNAKNFGVGFTNQVVKSYTTTPNHNFRRLTYVVSFNTPSASLPAVARDEYATGYSLKDKIKGLLWQLQAEKGTEFESFNNPVDAREQKRFCQMVGDWLLPRLPSGVVIEKVTFELDEPIVYQ